jgi:hypothetical protein
MHGHTKVGLEETERDKVICSCAHEESEGFMSSVSLILCYVPVDVMLATQGILVAVRRSTSLILPAFVSQNETVVM